MKKVVRVILALMLAALIIGVIYLKFLLPDVGNAPNLKVEINPQMVERGKYLAYHVTVCMDCHSTRDWSRFSGPPIAGSDGKGGEYFSRNMGFPGDFYSKNLTPFHLKDWTDGDIYRAITSGVSKDGSSLFPVMPYIYYGKLAKEDVYAIIAFLRTLPEINNTPPARSLDFPVNLLINTMPQEAHPTTIPARSDTLAYGAYLTNAAGCAECHTPARNGQIIKGKEFTGGRAFQMPSLTVYSANITPDTETGIGAWTPEEFVARFKAYTLPGGIPDATQNNSPQTVMPWTMYGGMDSTDLVAIYTYLSSLQPVKNHVDHFVFNKKG
ncbi:MAG: c-type cytochrome [Chitinophagaceae bacterium]|nr:c-type cytochrome [Chitinophagaceae bacterium]MCW5915139.1 c-type cytochrome [Chitinophagaceae bacterium]MCZ2396522.1 cytochrome c [Chitinophagales bacterium]